MALTAAPLTLTEKIIQAHIAHNAFAKGAPISRGAGIAIAIDQTLTQDATGTMAYLQFETIGVARVRTELSVSYIDHNTLQTDGKNMDDHRYLQSIAAKYGLWFSRAGNGICHQVHLERFGKPGKTLLGSDSHTPTGGALGMLAIGSGGLDVAIAMAGGAFHLAMPKIYGVRLTGRLAGGAGAKDVILELLRRETVKGGVGAVYEYFGAGVETLSVPERSTITNMGAELGATSSVFPSDARAKEFLAGMGRQEDWSAWAADEGAHYDRIIDIDLSAVEPLAACPHSPDAVKRVAELAGAPVSQVCIGSCTSSSLADLRAAAEIVRGRNIAPGVEAGIAPGSRAVMIAAAHEGILAELIRAGFRILESACGPCIGMGFAPNSGGVSLRTFNRNFKGRSGTADASVYLVSAQTAAASAVAGAFTVPQAAGAVDARVTMPRDDGMLIPPLDEAASARVQIERGPNIKPCPMPRALAFGAAELAVALKAGDNISTDDIMPAGAQVLPFRSNVPAISKFTFERIDASFYQAAEKSGFADCVVVGGENYGQGSSREHAALGPMFLGVRAVLAKSFARIHAANLVNYGIIPMTFAQSADYEKIDKGDSVSFANLDSALKTGGDFMLRVKKADGGTASFTAKNSLDERSRAVLLAGGLVAYARAGGQ